MVCAYTHTCTHARMHARARTHARTCMRREMLTCKRRRHGCVSLSPGSFFSGMCLQDLMQQCLPDQGDSSLFMKALDTVHTWASSLDARIDVEGLMNTGTLGLASGAVVLSAAALCCLPLILQPLCNACCWMHSRCSGPSLYRWARDGYPLLRTLYPHAMKTCSHVRPVKGDQGLGRKMLESLER